MRRSLVALIVLALVLAPTAAGARQQQDTAYRFEQVWSAAIRLIRVDYGCTITDRDEETGFFTFDWREGQRTYPGSFELVRMQVDGRDQVRAVVQIPAMPSYVEQMVLDRLARKLVDEYGEPPRPPPRNRQPPPPPDAGPPDAGAAP